MPRIKDWEEIGCGRIGGHIFSPLFLIFQFFFDFSFFLVFIQ